MVKDGGDLLATLLSVYGTEETRARRGKEEHDASSSSLSKRRPVVPEEPSRAQPNRHDASSSSLSKKRPVVSEEPSRAQAILVIQPNRHDASSSSLSKRRRVVSEEPIRAQPNRHDASSSSLSERRSVVSEEPIRAQPSRQIKPVRRRNRPVKREAVRREPGVTPGWVDELMRKKNGADVKLIIEKKITASDLDDNQGRLNMPVNQLVEMDFLNEKEVYIIEEFRRKARKEGVDVILVDADGEEWRSLNLRMWEMTSTSNYVLCSGWKKVVDHHNPKKGHIVRLWSFHSQDGELYFAINLKLPPRNTDQPLAQDACQALAPATASASASASASSMALVVTRDSDEAFICEETNRRLINFPKRRMTTRAPVPAPSRDSGNLGTSTVEDLDLNRPLPQVCTEMAPLEAVQETDTRTSVLTDKDLRASEMLIQMYYNN